VPLKISQTAALLEVVHAAIGLVKSPVGITGWCTGLVALILRCICVGSASAAMQVASRIWCLWGVTQTCVLPVLHMHNLFLQL
jgi:very-long-chain (3R)-3-hydroxyacyl-CoA dehydratase